MTLTSILSDVSRLRVNPSPNPPHKRTHRRTVSLFSRQNPRVSEPMFRIGTLQDRRIYRSRSNEILGVKGGDLLLSLSSEQRCRYLLPTIRGGDPEGDSVPSVNYLPVTIIRPRPTHHIGIGFITSRAPFFLTVEFAR